MANLGEQGAPKTARSKWPERMWLLLAVVLIVTGAAVFGLQRLNTLLRGGGITHEISDALEPVDRIEADAGDLRDFNVVIITTDTTRADHLGCYGNRSIRTPVLDGLAQEGILCSQAITPSPSTLPAHSSLLTGLYPYHHGVRANGTFRLRPEVTTLAERLRDKGYRTGAVISAFVLDSRFGLDQGFDLYHDDLTKGMKYSPHMFRERAAELTNEPASQWLRDNAGKPFFLWVHYFDPHAVYMPPEPFRSEYSDDLYDGEIAYADSQIGALLDQLKQLGVRDNTLVIYASDHGEGLGEHGEQTHSLLIYDSTLHVPLILNAPARLPRGKVLHHQAGLVDVVPTVLSLLGEEVPEDLDGMNLCERLPERPRPMLIETIATMTLHGWAPLIGVRNDDYKYILAPTPELYDLRSDPRELENLHNARRDVVGGLANRLAGWLGGDPYLAARQALDVSNLGLDREAMRHLNALGYVATDRGDKTNQEELGDPKEMVYRWESLQNAINLQARGETQAAIPILEESLAEVPGDVFARTVLAGAYRQMGELERALTHLKRAAEDDPNNETVRLSIAGVHLSLREYEQAEQHVQRALEIEPAAAQAYIVRGQIAQAKGDEEEALRLFQKAIEMDPGSAGPPAYNQIGFLHLYARRLDEARDAFRNAIRIDSLNGAAHDGLANILQMEGKVEEAIAELQIALRFDPNQPRALSTLASLISQKDNQDEALKLCKRAIHLSPKYAPAHSNLGLIFRRRDNFDAAEESYLEAIELDPRLDAARVNLAQLYIRQDRQEEALEQFRLAVQSNPRHPNPIALANLGAHHFNNGEHRKALILYRRALRMDPDYALVHKNIASIYILEPWNRPDLAAYHLRRSLQLDPAQQDFAILQETLEKLDNQAASREPSAPDQAPPDAPENDDPVRPPA